MHWGEIEPGALFVAVLLLWGRMEHRFTKLEEHDRDRKEATKDHEARIRALERDQAA